MQCYMCAREGRTHEAVAVCPDCFVGLCMEHLEEEFRAPRTEPHYTCNHPAPGTAGASRRLATARAPGAGS
jgi:hypothetical protein